jgi:hypothetical protein
MNLEEKSVKKNGGMKVKNKGLRKTVRTSNEKTNEENRNEKGNGICSITNSFLFV